jgi:hypothetical protein
VYRKRGSQILALTIPLPKEKILSLLSFREERGPSVGVEKVDSSEN